MKPNQIMIGAMINNTHSDLIPSDADKTATYQLRQQLQSQCPDLDSGAWWLLGTEGCHLCDIAESLIIQLQSVLPTTYQKLDIIDLDELTMNEFSTKIPVILTPNARLDYPFSILDLQQLAT